MKKFGDFEWEWKRFTFYIYNDYNSFYFGKKYTISWRNFTFIKLDAETNCYSTILEINFAILGLHFNFHWWRKPTK
jgi:hypothetical protein